VSFFHAAILDRTMAQRSPLKSHGGNWQCFWFLWTDQTIGSGYELSQVQ
jgi:hypothetical protein